MTCKKCEKAKAGFCPYCFETVTNNKDNKCMTIDIGNKYLYIKDKQGKQINYFEQFECKEIKNKIVKICSLDKEGDKFLRNNFNKVLYFNVKWFERKLKLKPIQVVFISGGDSYFDYLVLMY